MDTASGALDERPQLARILDHLRSGDTLVVWKLDRLGRSLRHLIDTIAELERRDIGFRSLQENIDTTSPGGKLIFHIFGALAESSAISFGSARSPGWRRPEPAAELGAVRRA